jgi:hypothetical protein
VRVHSSNPVTHGSMGAWSGLIGSALFVTVFTLEGAIRAGYDPFGIYVSELSLGPRGWIQRANFVVFGLLFLLFARGVTAEFPRGKASKAGPVMLAIVGLSLLASGLLVTDPKALLGNQTTWHGILHGIFGALVFSLAPVSCFVFGRRFRDDPAWRTLASWTMRAGVTITMMVLLMKVGQLSTNRLHAYVGLVQRMALVTYLAWIFAFAWRLRGPSIHRS